MDQLEDSIKRIPGVQAVTVMGMDTPLEIHIVAGAERSPKQLVRDIQSLASAGFGFAIDHRIVSIVRLEAAAGTPEARTASDQRPAPSVPEATPAARPAPSLPEATPAARPAPSVPEATPAARPAPSVPEATPAAPPSAVTAPPQQSDELRVEAPPESTVMRVDDQSNGNHVGATGQRGARPVLEQMIFGLKDGATWAKVALRWPDGTVTQGVSAAGEAREVRARAAGAALLKALQPHLDSRGVTLEIEQVVIHKSGPRELVLVRAMFSDKGALTPLAGSAIIHDDVATATVHALLHASNRKLIGLTA